MTPKKDNDTDGLMTVRDVCTEYDLSRSRVVNIIVKIPIKLQKHRANWYAVEDVEELMEEHRSMWDPDYYNQPVSEEMAAELKEIREALAKNGFR